MIFSTPTQFAVLALMLLVGWLFGLASHPGGKKWKRLHREEQDTRKREVADRDATIRDLQMRNDALKVEAERSRPAVATAPTRATTPTAAVATAGTATAATAATAATTNPGGKRGWFDWSRGDDLTRLRGVDGDLSRLLKSEGIDSYATLAAVSDQDELALERRLDLPAGYIARERLREQARLLAAGQIDEHGRTFG